MAFAFGMEKVFAPYAMAVCRSGGLPGIVAEKVETSELPLDEVDPSIAGSANVQRVIEEKPIYAPFSYFAAMTIGTPLGYKTIMRDGWRPTTERWVTAQKWERHLEQVVQFGLAKVDSTTESRRAAKDLGKSAGRGIWGWGAYFAVIKTETTARSIFNGKRTNKNFLPPRSVNICDPPRVDIWPKSMERCVRRSTWS